MRITKDEYVKAVNFIIEYQQMITSVSKEIGIIPESPIKEIVWKFVDTLMDVTDEHRYKVDYTAYFIYDLNCGKKWKPGTVIVDSHDVKFNTPESVYDFISAIQQDKEIKNSMWTIEQDLGKRKEVLATYLVCDMCGHRINVKEFDDYNVCPHCGHSMYYT